MNKLLEIFQAWKNAENPTKEQSDIAEYRISICNTCEYKKLLEHFDLWICGKCNCPLKGKSFSPIPSCPLQLWNK